jgi:hypothetical protein
MEVQILIKTFKVKIINSRSMFFADMAIAQPFAYYPAVFGLNKGIIIVILNSG